MFLQIIPIAEASAESLMKGINKVIINPLITLLFALALFYFIFALVKYLMNPDNEEIRKTNKTHMIWGVIGMFIMISVFGIMGFILKTIGEDNIQMQNGQININNEIGK